MPDSNSSGFSPLGFTIFALELNMAFCKHTSPGLSTSQRPGPGPPRRRHRRAPAGISAVSPPGEQGPPAQGWLQNVFPSKLAEKPGHRGGRKLTSGSAGLGRGLSLARNPQITVAERKRRVQREIPEEPLRNGKSLERPGKRLRGTSSSVTPLRLRNLLFAAKVPAIVPDVHNGSRLSPPRSERRAWARKSNFGCSRRQDV